MAMDTVGRTSDRMGRRVTTLRGQEETVESGSASRRVILWMVAILVVAGQAAAQTTPYQSSQRGAIGTGIGQTDLPDGGVFQPRIEAAVQYADNLNLAPDGQPQVNSAGLELAPGFYASYSTGSVAAAIDYSLVGRVWDDSDYNDVTQRLSANGQWIAVPEWFAITGQANYGDTVIDPRVGHDYGGLGVFGPNNLTEYASASVSPILKHRFNDFEALAQYTYGQAWYFDQGKGDPVMGFLQGQDSRDQAARLSFGTADEGRRMSAEVSYDWQKSEYDTALPYEYEQAGFGGGVKISRTLRIVGDVGKESDLDASTTQGGLDADFWSAGLRWAPNDRSSAEARFGQRFFGDSYLFRFSHRARILQFDASYSEEPTVQTRVLSLGGFDPGNLPPGTPPGIGVGSITSSPYVAKDARASVVAEGSRTTLTLTGYRDERDYLRSFPRDEISTGANLGASRQLASNLSVDFDLSYSDFEKGAGTVGDVAAGSTNDYDTTAIVRLNRKAGARTTLSGEAGYFNRSGGQIFDGWWVGLRARYEP